MTVGPSAAPRDRTADVLRGLAMAMVVLGHALLEHAVAAQPSVPVLLLSALEMPLFAFVSGYVVFGRVGSPRTKWLGRKSLQLLVPFLAWWVLYWFLDAIPTAVLAQDADGGLTSQGFVTYVWRVVQEPRIGLWYLWVLFGCYLLLAGMTGLSIRSSTALIVGGVALAEAAFLLVRVSGASGSFGIPLVLEYWPFFAGGYLVKRGGRRLRFERAGFARALLVLPAVLALGIAVAGGILYLPGSDLLSVVANLGIRWITGFAGIAFAVSFVQLVPLGAALRWLSQLGRITIGVYATHFLFLGASIGQGAVAVTSAFLIALGLSSALTLVLRRIPIVRGLLLGMWSWGSRDASPVLDDSAYATGVG